MKLAHFVTNDVFTIISKKLLNIMQNAAKHPENHVLYDIQSFFTYVCENIVFVEETLLLHVFRAFQKEICLKP